MERSKKLEQIVNALQAANKIKETYNFSYRSSRDNSVKPSNTSLAMQIMDIISRHSPEPHRSSLKKTAQQCSSYCEAYRNLKKHITVKKNARANREDFYIILNILRPLAGNREKYYIDKMIKIYELFK